MTPMAQTEIPSYFISHAELTHKTTQPTTRILTEQPATKTQASERTCKAHSKLQLRTNAAQSKRQTHGLKNGTEKPSQTKFPQNGPP